MNGGISNPSSANPENGLWTVGVDIGGTFTDVVATEPVHGEVRTAKVPSHAGDLVASVEASLEAVGIGWSDVGNLIHGTTLATNAIVEGNLAPVALLATEGFADTIDIGRQNRRELYRLDVPPKLASLVDRDHRVEVRERTDAQGAVRAVLDPDEARRAADTVASMGVEAAAVCLQHSYANPQHELILGGELESVVPYVSLSHDVSPEPREFERTNTTVLNASLKPLVAGYLGELEARAANRTNLHMFHSAGGMAAVDMVKEHPLGLALSGPAAGVAASARIAADLDLDAVIGLDMGGTTTDTSIVIDGQIPVGTDKRLAGRPIRQLMVDIESIGAGGGSIARVEGKAIRVGPDSAGADPGPACYGQGGRAPTVTDANLVLGHLNADRLLGGSVRLDAELAGAAVDTIAQAFGTSLPEAALGIYRVANASMARALRRVTVERGVDARQCRLLAFGGAGPMHAVALAREFDIASIVVPDFSSVFSALGCLTADLSYARQHAVRMSRDRWDANRLESMRRALADELSAPVYSAGADPGQVAVSHVASLRYAGQSDTVDVAFDAPADPERLGAEFKRLHRQLYGFATDEPWELDTLRITVSMPRGQAGAIRSAGAQNGTVEPASVSACWFDAAGSRATPRYERATLPRGKWRSAGPVIIEDDWSTIVVPPGASASVDRSGHVHVDVGGEA